MPFHLCVRDLFLYRVLLYLDEDRLVGTSIRLPHFTYNYFAGDRHEVNSQLVGLLLLYHVRNLYLYEMVQIKPFQPIFLRLVIED